MFQTYQSYVIIWGIFAAIVLFFLQRMLKKQLDTSQYIYMRDLLLMGTWMLLTIWLGSPQTRFLVGIAVLAALIGLAQNLWGNRLWALSYLGVGLISALFGPSIKFVSFVNGEYLYFSTSASIIATALWFFMFPFILQLLDVVPSLTGHLLGVCFSLMLMAVYLSTQRLNDAFFMTFTGLIMLVAFWSRYGNPYRNAGHSMCAFWGVLVAGSSILGVGKGIAFGALFFLPMGLFALPMLEASIKLINSRQERDYYYRKLIASGFDHIASVRLITVLCALIGMGVGAWQLDNILAASVFIAVAVIVVLLTIIPLMLRADKSSSRIQSEKPVLWGVPIDNVSINYALSRVTGELHRMEREEDSHKNAGCQMIATVNALAIEAALKDKEYHSILKDTLLTLSDGTGLKWGLSLLGTPVQERVTGIDFAYYLCRLASMNGWPVYFLGAEGNVSKMAANALTEKYPDLIITGARNGYFDFDDEGVPREIVRKGTKILFVAMGIPRQEKWIKRHSDILCKCIAVGLGGSFDVISGKLKRAPLWMQKCGLEWFYRLIQEPWRWRRMLGLPVFVFRILLSKFGLYSYKE
ncbi:MAG: WecB/TagA/CpsF family glycosyltransferase [Synergistaceae bacterium]|nr:WecB/TagA/CpsF family glycosyltransferase [Synergistaceae bacterium]